MTERSFATRMTVRGALKVPEITIWFWAIKALSTAMGESSSDYLVHAITPVLAVGLGFIGLRSLRPLRWAPRSVTSQRSA